MNPSRHFRAALGLLAWPWLLGAAKPAPDAFEPLQIDQTWDPSFPVEAANLDLSAGQARIVVMVDATGRLRDHLVVGYTHPAFAAAAVEALEKWRYRPARLDGQPLATTKEISFNFEQRGMVLVTVTADEFIQSRMREMIQNNTGYRAYGLNELDRALTPSHVVRPIYPQDLRDRGISGTVSVQYYVDEKGLVRMPVVTNRASPELAGLATDALQQWQFTPPLRHGRPVLVLVSQDIRFNPAK